MWGKIRNQFLTAKGTKNKLFTAPGSVIARFSAVDFCQYGRKGSETMTVTRLISVLWLALICCFALDARAQTVAAPSPGTAAATPDNAIMITVFLKHDQSRPLSELNAQLQKQGFYKAFPPAGMEVVSWNIVMGIGQVIVVRLPASRLRELNRVLEDTAWGSYRTEFFPTYDYKAVGLGNHEKALGK
jgi:hypothetical protein